MEKNIPRRRFKEFVGSGKWEEKKLGEVADIVRGASPRPIDDPKWFDEKSDIGWLRISDVTKQDGRIYYLEQHISKLGQEKTRVVIKPHILLSIAATVGKPVINYVKTGVHDGFLIFLDLKCDHEFIFQWLEMFRPNWKKYGQPGSQVNLNSTIVRNQIVRLPSLAEQEKIGNFFQKLDRLIDINREKLDKLKASKSAYLTEMFPGEGEDRPRRRFQGFTGEWEENKFEDILDSSEGIRRGPFGSALKKDCFVKRSIYVVYEQRNAIEDKYDVRYYITKEKYDELSNFHLKPGDYIMSGAGTIGCISRVPKNIKKGVFNQALIRIRINDKLLNDNYFLIWMRSPNMQKRLTGANPASAMVNLVPMVELKEWSVLIPSLAEQEKIGHFFKKLDQQIEVQEEKLEKLEKMKKAYLAEMFV